MIGRTTRGGVLLHACSILCVYSALHLDNSLPRFLATVSGSKLVPRFLSRMIMQRVPPLHLQNMARIVGRPSYGQLQSPQYRWLMALYIESNVRILTNSKRLGSLSTTAAENISDHLRYSRAYFHPPPLFQEADDAD